MQVIAKAFVLALAFTVPLAAQSPDTARLTEIIVTATRTPTPSHKVGSSVDALEQTELKRRQLRTLMNALQLLNGGVGFATGAPGAANSFFLRGAASTQTLILVDGMRLNDSNLSPGSFLGGTDLAGSGRVEVVRGPQSTLYGGAAIGGVVALDAEPGDGPAHGSLEIEGGSFGSWRATGGLAGASGGTRYALSLSANETENERRPNGWNQRTQLVRIDQGLSRVLSGGATFRGLQQEYVSPGDLRSTNTTPSGRTTFENNLATFWLAAVPVPAWRSRLLGGAQEHFTRGTGRYNGGPESAFSISGARRVLDWQNTVTIRKAAVLVAGLNREWSTVSSDGAAMGERLLGMYADAQLTPIASFTMSAGLRSDDYNTFDDATTWRVTGAWSVAGSETKLRASIGTGFAPPSLAARFGSVYQNPNPGIRPERSRGWDAGVDQLLLNGRSRLSATWFHNSLTDLIGWESAPYPLLGRNVNLEAARTTGLEVSGRIVIGGIDARVAWTALSAINASETDPGLARLIRRPRHTIAADLSWQVAASAVIGGSGLLVTGREDTDFNVFPSARVNPGDYLVARLYGSWDVLSRFTVTARVENLFDRRYEPVYGFPALPRSVAATASVRF